MAGKQPKITTCLWFDGNAEEAVKFYTSVFKSSKILATTRFGESGPGPKGSICTITFEVEGQQIMALNGGPEFKFTEAISLVVHCETQAEIDDYWRKLTAGGGQEVQCGWLRDRFGLSWQIVPTRFMQLLAEADLEKTDRLMKAMFPMKKLDLAALERAAAGK
jgi:predicted 3-demethylubiquinone-9 3-methyltransferase (glyoxalase superfamily)